MKKRLIKIVLSTFLVSSIGAILTSCGNDKGNNTNQTEPTTNITTPAISTTQAQDITTNVVLNTYEVKFDSDGGNNIDTQTINENSKAFAPTPTKEGKKFLGWFLNDKLFDFDTPISSNITLKAKWGGTEVELGGFYKSEKSNKEVFIYDDSYFNTESNVFNKDLAMFLYGASISNDGNTVSSKYYTELGFTKATIYPEKESDYKGIYYVIAEKDINDNKLILVSVRGMGYGNEWASNFDIGISGNHNGFESAANVVFEGLTNYIDSINYEGEYKIALTGYSRGGGVANVLADKILKMEDKITSNENVYTYTFEASKGIFKNDIIPYDNVFNIINGADIVPLVAPEQYGFARCGIDINIYNPNIDELLSNCNNELVLPTFTPNELFKKETDLNKFIIDKLISTCEANREFSLRTRNDYINNYSETIQYGFDFVNNLSNDTLNKIISDIRNKAASGITTVIGILSTGDSLYNYLTAFLDEDNVSYNEGDLKTACDNFVGLAQNPGLFLLIIIAEGNLRADLIRMIDMHYPIIIYILLENYNN